MKSRTIFKFVNSGQDVYVLRVRIARSVVKVCVIKVKVPVAVQSSGQATENESKFSDPGCSCDYSAFGSDHPLIHWATIN